MSDAKCSRLWPLVALALCVACNPITAADDAGSLPPSPQDDAQASAYDAGPDARPDARPPPSAPPAKEITGGGTRLQGGGYTMDVQIGHGLGQGRSSGGPTSTEGGAAIKP